MKILAASIALVLLSSTVVWAQGAVSQSGTVIQNRAAKWTTKGVIADAGPASGGNASVGISELPIVGLGKTLCLYDAPVTNALGYHQLCLGASVDGNALISLAAGGAATPNGLVININGTPYPFPGAGSGTGNVTGPPSSTIGHVPIFNNTTGNLLADAPASQFQVQGTTATATLSSLNNLYQPTTSQLSAFVNNLTLSGILSDATASFRDGFYSSVTDNDTTTYTKPHNNYGGRFASFGPNSGGWLNTHKNIIGLSAYGSGATIDTILSNGVSPAIVGIAGEAVQHGSGISVNYFIARNPSAASGGIAQSKSVVPLQAILDNSFADADATHLAYAVLATNVSTKRSTAAYGASGSGQYETFLDGGTVVTMEGIRMPASSIPTNYSGTIINYGIYNGNPPGGSFTSWDGATRGGQYRWIDSGTLIGSWDTLGIISRPAAGGDAYLATPALTATGNIAFAAVGAWNDGLNLGVGTYVDSAIILNTTVTGSAIKYDATNFTRINAGAYEISVGTVKFSVGSTLTQISNGAEIQLSAPTIQLSSATLKLPSITATPTGLQPVCIDTTTKMLYQGAAGAC